MESTLAGIDVVGSLDHDVAEMASLHARMLRTIAEVDRSTDRVSIQTESVGPGMAGHHPGSGRHRGRRG